MSTFPFSASQVRYLEERSNVCQEGEGFLSDSFHDSSLAKLPGQACQEFPVTRKGSLGKYIPHMFLQELQLGLPGASGPSSLMYELTASEK